MLAALLPFAFTFLFKPCNARVLNLPTTNTFCTSSVSHVFSFLFLFRFLFHSFLVGWFGWFLLLVWFSDWFWFVGSDWKRPFATTLLCVVREEREDRTGLVEKMGGRDGALHFTHWFMPRTDFYAAYNNY